MAVDDRARVRGGGRVAGLQSGRDGLSLCIFIHEALRHKGAYLYEAIVEQARREGLAGATVFRGMEGYGMHRHLHTTRLVDLSDDLPVVVEIVDTAERIQRFLPILDLLVPHGAATLSPVAIVKYSAGGTA